MTGKHHKTPARAAAEECPRCRASRWRTLDKRRRWRCRRCGYIRDLAPSTPEEDQSRVIS